MPLGIFSGITPVFVDCDALPSTGGMGAELHNFTPGLQVVLWVA